MIYYYYLRKSAVRRHVVYIYKVANNLLIEMKDIYTNALASNISKMPKLFRIAIKNSRL